MISSNLIQIFIFKDIIDIIININNINNMLLIIRYIDNYYIIC